jgi:hypothetical protein
LHEHQIHGWNHGGPTTNRGRIRLVVFRVLAAVASLFFLVAVVLAVPAPWVLVQPEDPNAAENRWFLTVAGSVDQVAVVGSIGRRLAWLGYRLCGNTVAARRSRQHAAGSSPLPRSSRASCSDLGQRRIPAGDRHSRAGSHSGWRTPSDGDLA